MKKRFAKERPPGFAAPPGRLIWQFDAALSDVIDFWLRLSTQGAKFALSVRMTEVWGNSLSSRNILFFPCRLRVKMSATGVEHRIEKAELW
jgi:hypothetical protein